MWLAFQFDPQQQRWIPSIVFSKIYRLASHVRSALKVRQHKKNHRWTIRRDEPGYIECELTHLFRNPLTHRTEEHVSPNSKVIFIEISELVRQRLPIPDNRDILPLAAIR